MCMRFFLFSFTSFSTCWTCEPHRKTSHKVHIWYESALSSSSLSLLSSCRTCQQHRETSHEAHL